MTKKPNAFDRAKPIEDYDIEELEKGRPRNSKGGFAGKPPAVPARIYQQMLGELNRRRLIQVAELIRDSLVEATEVARSILLDPDARDADRIKVWELLLDRAYGKAIQPLIVARRPDAEKPLWQQAVDEVNDIDPREMAAAAMSDPKILRALEHGSVRDDSPEGELRRLRLENARLRDAADERHNWVPSENRYEGTSRPAADDDEQLVRQYLDEEIAEEFLGDPGAVAG